MQHRDREAAQILPVEPRFETDGKSGSRFKLPI